MSNAPAVFRSLLVYGLCLPLAVFLGYLLANPLDPTTLMAVGVVLLALLIPLLLRWHHVWLIATWNMSAVVFFLPGRPNFWVVLAIISFTIGVLQYAMNRDLKFIYVPSVARPLLFLAIVVLITAYVTGGIGMRAFGSATYGGKNYILLFTAIIGFFALTSRRIPPHRAVLYVQLFFLGTCTLAIGELARILPSEFNFLYLTFPVLTMSALVQQSTSVVASTELVTRITGLSGPAIGVYYAMLAHYGIRGIFLDLKLWRVAVFCLTVVIGALSGFRSITILFAMTFAVLFFLERLHHTRLLPIFAIAGLLSVALLIPFANQLPFAVQRSLAFLPLNLDTDAKISAITSTEWRLQMWRDIWPEVPQYLWQGKGYSFSGRELDIALDTARSSSGLESTEMAGDYHNGPLSVIIPFGIAGALGFCWFLWAGLRVVYQNYLYGDPVYRCINTFVFAYFLVKIIFFFVAFGGLVVDLAAFAGLTGLSISLNGGVAKPALVPQPQAVARQMKLQPGARRPVSV